MQFRHVRRVFELICVSIVIIYLFATLIGFCITSFKPEDEKLLPFDGKNTNKTFANERIINHNFKAHVTYVHYLNTNQAVTTENFRFFLNFAYVPCSDDIFFTIIINYNVMNQSIDNYLIDLIGTVRASRLISCTFNDNSVEKTHFIKNTALYMRKNTLGGDLCAIVDFMSSKFWLVNSKKFLFYFFINSSSRGPFLPTYWLRPWWEIFTQIFEKYPTVAVVGPYMSCEFGYHIQSFMFVVDKRGLDVLAETFYCLPLDKDRFEWIIDTEVKFGQNIIKKGFEIKSLLALYKSSPIGKDYRKECRQKNPATEYPINKKKILDFLLKNFVKQKIAKKFVNEGYSANIFEVVWCKFGGNIKISEYTQKYVHLYTQIMYENQKNNLLH